MSGGLYVFKTSNLVPGLPENNKTITGLLYVPEPTVCLAQDRRNPKSNFDDNLFVVADPLSRNVAI